MSVCVFMTISVVWLTDSGPAAAANSVEEEDGETPDIIRRAYTYVYIHTIWLDLIFITCCEHELIFNETIFKSYKCFSSCVLFISVDVSNCSLYRRRQYRRRPEEKVQLSLSQTSEPRLSATEPCPCHPKPCPYTIDPRPAPPTNRSSPKSSSEEPNVQESSQDQSPSDIRHQHNTQSYTHSITHTSTFTLI